MVRYVLRRGGLGGCVAVAVAVSLLVVSCGGSHTADPYAVPSKITPRYVQRVLNALEGVNGRATRLIVRNHRLVPQAVEILRSIDSNKEYPTQHKIWESDINSGLANYLDPPGSVRDTLHRVLTANKACIYASIVRDYSQVDVVPPKTHLTYIGLRRSSSKTRINPTPWKISFLGFSITGYVPPNPC